MAEIPERMQAEEALRENEERFRALIEHSNDAIALFGADGTILYASPSTTNVVGYLPEELHQRNALEFVHPDWQDAMREVLAESFRRPGVGIPAESYVRHKDGRWRHLEGIFTNLLHVPSVGAVVNNYRDITARKRVEEALREGEERLRLAVQASNVGLWDWNLKTNRVVYSREWKSQLGYAESEISDDFEEWRSRIHPHDLPRALAAIEAARESSARGYDTEFRMRHKDGSWRWILVKGKIFRDAACKPVRMIGSHVDITERKFAEAAIKEHERQLTTLISNLPGMVYRCRNDPDYPVDFVSDGVTELTGYPAADFRERRRHLGALMHPGDRERIWTEAQNALRENREFEFTYRIYAAGGSEKWLWERGRGVRDASGTVEALEGFVTDITERKRAQEALSIERNLLREIIDAIPDFISLNDREGRYILVNHAMARGHPTGAAGGGLPRDVLDTELADTIEAEDNQVFATGEPIININRSSIVNGETHHRLITKVPLRDGAGNISGVIGIGRDVTDLHRAHEALRELSRRLLEAQESERRALARELHDRIGQNVTALSLNLGMIRSGLPAAAMRAAEARLADCEALLDDTAQLIRDVMIDLRPPGLDELGLVTALNEHARQVAGRSALKVTVRGIEAAPRLSPVMEVALFRIAQEALVNVARHARATEVVIALEAGPDTVKLVIADNGCGFDAAAPHFRPRANLGMATMRERAQSIGGQLRVESGAGAGTRVIVEAPR